MTDYNKLTVKDLKALLKERNIPQTGLTRKAQYVSALEQADATDGAANDAPSAAQDVIEEPSVVLEESQESKNESAEDEVAQRPEAEAQAGESSASAEHITVDAVSDARAQTEADPTPHEEAQERPAAAADASTDTEEVATTAEGSQGWGEPPLFAASANLTHTSTMDSVRTEELIEDRMKRKRRSASPPVSDTEVKQKKLRQDSDDGAVHLKEGLSSAGDNDVARNDAATNIREPAASQGEPATDEVAKSPVVGTSTTVDARSTAAPKEREGRYKDILSSTATTAPGQTFEEVEDRAVAPAIHPASSAIYISNLQRPLSPASLRSHLVTLAAPPATDSNPEVIQAFFVDGVKSHAFVLFDTVQAASRVRASLHGRAWPAERDRKPLWIDFIPEERCEEWIAFEGDNSNGPRSGGTRWEVAYDEDENGVVARLVEFGASGLRKPSLPGHRESTDLDRKRPQAPTEGRPPATAKGLEPPRTAAPQQPEREAQKFVNLDKAFQSTTAKPKLYFLPVANNLADRRLDEFDRLVSRDWSAKRATVADEDQLKRYTFEDGDVLVDSGVHPMPGRGRGGGFGGGPPPRRGGYGRDDGGYGSYRPR